MTGVGALAASLGIAGTARRTSAQQPARPRRIGVLLVASARESKEVRNFREGLRDAGYAEGRDALIEWRSANGSNDRISELAVDLVQRDPEVIVAETTPGVRAVKQATSIIPIVMTVVSDPVGSGLVANLARPGGNVTGLSVMGSELGVKRLQLLKDTVPELSRVAVLWNPDARAQTKTIDELKQAAHSLSLQLSLVPVRAEKEIGAAFATINRTHAQAICVLSDAQLLVHRGRLLDLASKARIPAIYIERRFVDDGGLMSYGVDWAQQWRRAAGYVDKILKGTLPGDLPIEQPTKLEFVVNLGAAKAIGLVIPESVLLRADDIIK